MAHATRRSFRNAALGTLAVGALALLSLALRDGGAQLAELDAIAPAASHTAAASLASDRGERADAELRFGCWDAPVGTELRFHLDDQLTVKLRSKDGGEQPGATLHVAGDLVTTVLARRADEVLVQHVLHDTSCLGADGRPVRGDALADALHAAAATPVHVRLQRDGAVLGYAFAPGLDGDQRNFLRGLLGLCAFPTPNELGTTAWTVRSEDATGAFQAHCTARGDDASLTVTRVRDGYTSMVGHAEPPAHELRGTARATFSLRTGWLESMQLAEGMTLMLPLADLQAITQRQATVTKTGTGTAAVPADVAALWAAATAPATSLGEALGGHAAAAERARWQQTLQGLDAARLLAEIEQLFARPPVDPQALDAAFQKLQWLVALDDRAADDIERAVFEARVREDAMRTAVGALGAAGTERSQQALANLCFDGSRPVAVREAAALATLQLPKPSPALVEGMFRAAGDGSGSLLIAGALAGRASAPLADGRTPLQALLDQEGDARARGDVVTWLHALGNTRSPAALPIALRYLDDVDPAARAAACVVLRDQNAPEAIAALVERGLQDTDPRVRLESVLALSTQPTPTVREALQRVADQDVDPTVRARAQRALQAA